MNEVLKITKAKSGRELIGVITELSTTEIIPVVNEKDKNYDFYNDVAINIIRGLINKLTALESYKLNKGLINSVLTLSDNNQSKKLIELFGIDKSDFFKTLSKTKANLEKNIVKISKMSINSPSISELENLENLITNNTIEKINIKIVKQIIGALPAELSKIFEDCMDLLLDSKKPTKKEKTQDEILIDQFNELIIKKEETEEKNNEIKEITEVISMTPEEVFKNIRIPIGIVPASQRETESLRIKKEVYAKFFDIKGDITTETILNKIEQYKKENKIEEDNIPNEKIIRKIGYMILSRDENILKEMQDIEKIRTHLPEEYQTILDSIIIEIKTLKTKRDQNIHKMTSIPKVEKQQIVYDLSPNTGVYKGYIEEARVNLSYITSLPVTNSYKMDIYIAINGRIREGLLRKEVLNDLEYQIKEEIKLIEEWTTDDFISPDEVIKELERYGTILGVVNQIQSQYYVPAPILAKKD